MTRQYWFTPELFDFLSELKQNNDRAWFQVHKDRYERFVRQPFMHFISALAPRMEKISKEIRVDPRPVGGSLFRIHRDTRFAADKSPYKTHAGAQFRHTLSTSAHAPGYYLHLEPGTVFACGGVWQPEKEGLGRIRDAIVARADEWKKITRAPAFARNYQIRGDSLKRPPQGYPADHPFIEDLKRKDIYALREFTEADACEPDFLDRFVEVCRDTAPLMKFLCEAQGYDW